MLDTVVVTLKANGFEKDFELPCNVALKELYPRMLNVLKKVKPSLFEAMKGIVFEKDRKGLVSFDAVLTDYGVCSGTVLTVAEEGKYFV